MARDASELARGLAREAEAVCRHYLSNGKREGRYWLVGDVHKDPPASGQTLRHPSTAICSTSSEKALGFATSAKSRRKRGDF